MAMIYVLTSLTSAQVDTCPIMAFMYKPTRLEVIEVCQTHINDTLGADDGYTAQFDDGYEKNGLINIFDPNYEDVMDDVYLLTQVECRE